MYLDKLESFPLGSIIQNEYIHISSRAYAGSSEYQLPHLGELVEETGGSTILFIREENIKAAIMRNEHELYSMTKRQFVKAALSRKITIHGEEVPDMNDISFQVIKFLQSRCMSYMDYEDKIWNCHIGREVW